MATFKLNKLIRAGLLPKYEALGQIPKLRKLNSCEHMTELSHKGIEEFTEMKPELSVEEMEDEVADVLQVIDDIIAVRGLSLERILAAKQRIYDDKGGFTEGVYVEELYVRDDDEKWTTYYRSDPDRFPETKE